MARESTERDRAKANRHTALLGEAARLFAERGFAGVSLEDLGAAVGISGPAVYRHFAGKQAVLGAILVIVSEELHAGGRAVMDGGGTADVRLDRLVGFHVDFALTQPDVIRVQDREMSHLLSADSHAVRRLQREYVEMWVKTLAKVHAHAVERELRVRAHACFGLINSTPHTVRLLRDAPDVEVVRSILHTMARAALA